VSGLEVAAAVGVGSALVGGAISKKGYDKSAAAQRLAGQAEVMRSQAESESAKFEQQQREVDAQVAGIQGNRDETVRRNDIRKTLENITVMSAARGGGGQSAALIAGRVSEEGESDIGMAKYGYLAKGDLARRQAVMAGQRGQLALQTGRLAGAAAEQQASATELAGTASMIASIGKGAGMFLKG
jgi:hypothetical protein